MIILVVLELQDQLNLSQETIKRAEESTDHLKESIGRKSAELVRHYDWSKEGQVSCGQKSIEQFVWLGELFVRVAFFFFFFFFFFFLHFALYFGEYRLGGGGGI